MKGHVVFYSIYIIKLIFQLATISVHYGWCDKHYVQKHVSYYYHVHCFYILKYIFVRSLRIPVTFYEPLFSFSSQFVCFFFACLQEDRGARRGLLEL